MTKENIKRQLRRCQDVECGCMYHAYAQYDDGYCETCGEFALDGKTPPYPNIMEAKYIEIPE